METIRNYLELMFADLPNTPEVMRAKEELYQMMEDRYDAAIAEGKREHEAVGMVIAEFGNLDELAETLGIEKAVREADEPRGKRTMLSLQQAHCFIDDSALHAMLVALGVLLCIVSPVGVIIADAFSSSLFMTIGVIVLFMCIAAAVVIFIISGRVKREWDFMEKEPCGIEYGVSEELIGERKYVRSVKTILLTLGIVLCILAPVSAIAGDYIAQTVNAYAEDIGAAGVLVIVAAGVFLIIYSGGRDKAYMKLLKLNDASTVRGSYAYKDNDREMHIDTTGFLGSFLSVYWPAVTCIYLLYSFLTSSWATSWLIWPVASLVRKMIINLADKK